MPKPDVMREKVKQVPLRLPEGIYDKIMSKAKEKGMSFNGFVAVMLEGV